MGAITLGRGWQRRLNSSVTYGITIMTGTQERHAAQCLALLLYQLPPAAWSNL